MHLHILDAQHVHQILIEHLLYALEMHKHPGSPGDCILVVGNKHIACWVLEVMWTEMRWKEGSGDMLRY